MPWVILSPLDKSSKPNTSTSWKGLRLTAVGQTHRWREAAWALHTHQQAVAQARRFCPGAGRRPGSPPGGRRQSLPPPPPPVRAETEGRRGGDGSPHNLLRGLCAECLREGSGRGTGLLGVRPRCCCCCCQPAAVASVRNTERAAARRAASTCRGRGARGGAGPGSGAGRGW